MNIYTLTIWTLFVIFVLKETNKLDVFYINVLSLVFVLQDSIPFAVIGGNTVVEVRGQRVRGRLYPWGVVEGKTLNSSSSLPVLVQLWCLISSRVQWRTRPTATLWSSGTCWSEPTCTTWRTSPLTVTMRTTGLSASRPWPGETQPCYFHWKIQFNLNLSSGSFWLNED